MKNSDIETTMDEDLKMVADAGEELACEDEAGETQELGSQSAKNPFSVQTPDGISAEDALSLFVNVFTDFPNIPEMGHTFIHGPRGCGKTMMFRYLQPDCQLLKFGEEFGRPCQLHELPFFSVFVPIKSTNLALTELLRLKIKEHADVILNEHFMTSYVSARVFSAVRTVVKSLDESDQMEAYLEASRAFLRDSFASQLHLCGWEGEMPEQQPQSVDDCFRQMEKVCNTLNAQFVLYLRRLSASSTPEYQGPLCSYLEFLYPVLQEMRELPFMPKGPVFLLIDDADNLNHTQTAILNSWVSTRTIKDASFKISTQLNYKTYRTIAGRSVESPHDFTEVNISTIYTGTKNRYRQRVEEIVRKRLQQAGLPSDPYAFFPRDEKQEAAIEAIKQEIRDSFPIKGRGYEAKDDVNRYARPTYIARLKGKSKSGSTYSYAGFEQLVHVSSGLVRYFLEPAAEMFSHQVSSYRDQPVTHIEPHIQNRMVRAAADELLFDQIAKLAKEPEQDAAYYTRVKKLDNLIRSLGGLFHLTLLSNRADRRVFSIYISDEPDQEVLDVLKLGIEQGFFHVSSLTNKQGTGRKALYVLTRRLAPAFLLDPSGFAGYQSVTNQYLHKAMNNPAHIRRLQEGGLDKFLDQDQKTLFEDNGDILPNSPFGSEEAAEGAEEQTGHTL